MISRRDAWGRVAVACQEVPRNLSYRTLERIILILREILLRTEYALGLVIAARSDIELILRRIRTTPILINLRNSNASVFTQT